MSAILEDLDAAYEIQQELIQNYGLVLPESINPGICEIDPKSGMSPEDRLVAHLLKRGKKYNPQQT
jgi:hypothetical protein